MASIKDLKRMCDSYEECKDCPMFDVHNGCRAQCAPCYISDNIDDIVDIVDIVDKWAAEQPLKTYAQDFFKKFPNTCKSRSGEPISCVKEVYGVDFDCCGDCYACWNEKMEDR